MDTQAAELLNGATASRHPSWWCGWMAAAMLAAVIACMYAAAAAQTTLWDRDEPRFSRATVEMVQSGNYLYPTYNGVLRADKPIMVYWLMSLPVRLWGQSELSCRLFSAIGSAISCLLTYAIARRLMGPGVGMLSMLLLASSPLMVVMGTLSTADAITLPWILLALLAFTASATEGVRPLHVLVLCLAVAGAMLAKGPLGLIPLGVVAGALVLGRGGRLAVGWRFGGWALLATAVGVGAFAAWAVPANMATDGQIMALFLGKHVGARATVALEEHGGSGYKYFLYLPYYLPAVAVGFFPWCVHVPAAISAAAGGRLGGQRGRAMLLAWIVVVFVVISLAATKLPHYGLAIWPALAIASAGVLAALRAGALAPRDMRWLRLGAWVFGVCGALAGLAAAVGGIVLPGRAPFAVPQQLATAVTVLGATLLVVSVAAIVLHIRGRWIAGAVAMLVGIVLVHCASFGLVLPAFEQLKISPQLARDMMADPQARELPAGMYGYKEPSLVFYAGRQIPELRGRDAMTSLAAAHPRVLLVMPRAELAPMQARVGGSYRLLAQRAGLNYSSGKWEDVVAVVWEGATAPPASAPASPAASP